MSESVNYTDKFEGMQAIKVSWNEFTQQVDWERVEIDCQQAQISEVFSDLLSDGKLHCPEEAAAIVDARRARRLRPT